MTSPEQTASAVLTVGQAFGSASSRHPTVRVGEAAWLSYVRARELAELPADDELVDDLFVACGCTLGAAGALESFDARFHALIEQVARSFDPAPHFCDEVKQELRRTLFVSTSAAGPRIAQFAGRGPLASWVVTIAKRIALRLKKGQAERRYAREDALAQQLSPERDVEWAWLAGRYRDAIERALTLALRQLSTRDRMILRLHTVRGLTMGVIARMYGVSQPTVSRWMRDAREQVQRAVLAAVSDECHCEDHELESIVRLVQSQLELSVSSLEPEP
ncbi:MAG TPA: sigma-70 family RNA polymerase sigma factor [Polyangiales bacterium]|nr:sigma-70 family RNA polymerase sigma factor [Polyangiales bacterium]